MQTFISYIPEKLSQFQMLSLYSLPTMLFLFFQDTPETTAIILKDFLHLIHWYSKDFPQSPE